MPDFEMHRSDSPEFDEELQQLLRPEAAFFDRPAEWGDLHTASEAARRLREGKQEVEESLAAAGDTSEAAHTSPIERARLAFAHEIEALDAREAALLVEYDQRKEALKTRLEDNPLGLASSEANLQRIKEEGRLETDYHKSLGAIENERAKISGQMARLVRKFAKESNRQK